MAFIIVNALTGICLVVSLVKDRKKTVEALKIAWKTGIEMMPLVIIIVAALGLLAGFIPSNSLSGILQGNSGFLIIPLMAIIGSFLALPAPVIFPIAASLLRTVSRAGNPGFYGIASVAALITCNTMVCSATLPLEIKIMGSRSAWVRILGDFVAAVAVAVLMGVILHGYRL